MFKNPLKYQQGGSTANTQQQEQLIQLFQAAAKNAQVDPEALVQKAQEISKDETSAAQFMEGLQRCAQGDPAGIKFIQDLFKSQAFRNGGKIHDFICKHAKGGVTGCGCSKMQDGGLTENNKYNGTRATSSVGYLPGYGAEEPYTRISAVTGQAAAGKNAIVNGYHV